MYLSDLCSQWLGNVGIVNGTGCVDFISMKVGTWEIPAHRVILACCSPYLFELFSTDDGGKCSEESIITYKLNGCFEKDSLEHLINYAYTGKCVEFIRSYPIPCV